MANRGTYLPVEVTLTKSVMAKIVKQMEQLKTGDLEAELRFFIDAGYTVKFSVYKELYQVTVTEKEKGEDGVHMFVSTRSKSPFLSLHATLRKLEACEGMDLRNAKAEADPDVSFV